MNTLHSFQVYNASAGSGKTFTLVKEYLKIILKSSDVFKFQQILAITFTNKAAAEMKFRIISNLRLFANKKNEHKNNDMFVRICNELNLEKEIVQQRSLRVLKSVLNNYASFNITTIDSFTYKLIKSFAYDLGLSLNFEVEMDAIALLNEAVDMLISKIGNDKEITKTLVEFSIQKTAEDKSWDITFDLQEIAKLLLNEDDLFQLEKIKNRPIQDFVKLKSTIYKQQKIIESQFAEIGQKGLEIINGLGIEHKDFYYSQFPKFFQYLNNDLGKISFNKEKGLAKSIVNELYYTKGKSTEIKSAIDAVISSLLVLYNKVEINYQTYLLNKLILNSLIPLAVLRSINDSLNELKEDKNIRLISEFNQLISEHLREQPAAFIYEKIGEKYRHYFIDEMQDTSELQWQNLIPLLSNALTSQNEKGEVGSLLLVGDAKQSIYRWRGGKAEQFIGLTNDDNPFFVPKKIEELPTNYRSFSEIIEFNNSFFQFLSAHLKNETYKQLYLNGNQQLLNTKKGGFVQFSFLPEGMTALEKDETYGEKILQIIKNLNGKFTKDEICILTRTRKQGVAIANFLTDNDIDIISSETLLLQYSDKVNFIIDLLKLIVQPKDKEAKFSILLFLYYHLKITNDKHEFVTDFIDLDNLLFFEKLINYNVNFNTDTYQSLTFYESIEYIIRVFNLTADSDAYLQFFLDVILEFSTKKSEGISSFLDYWSAKKDRLSIVVPEGKDAVKIMTIHKAKGLEFPVVIYPYDLDIYRQINPKIWYESLEKEHYENFETSFINFSSSLKEVGTVGEKMYQLKREELELDNFNLLYVALTRAEEQLYIISEHQKEFDEPKKYSQFFINYLKNVAKWNENEDVFEFGGKNRVSEKQILKAISSEQKQFISSDWKNHNITIVANTSFDKDFDDAREYGTIIHEILAKIYTKKDIKKTINHFVNEGIIPLEKSDEVFVLISKIVHHNELTDYFKEELTILNEREILNDDRLLLIPDRLVIHKNKVTIIDYKTGKKEKKHQVQINNYAEVLEKMNYTISKKIVVYISNEIEVLEV